VNFVNSDQRARIQSTDEWLEELYTGRPVPPSARLGRKPIIQRTTLKYDHHRTSKRGNLILAFIDEQTKKEIVCFFNVDVSRQRGEKKGQLYRTGLGGQFLPPERGKFRKFWLKVVGQPPSRWASVYKHLNRQLGGRVFTGALEVRYRNDGTPFDMVTEVFELLEPDGNLN
jgi:hypothetical protein